MLKERWCVVLGQYHGRVCEGGSISIHGQGGIDHEWVPASCRAGRESGCGYAVEEQPPNGQSKVNDGVT